jgi:hypothetical protein
VYRIGDKVLSKISGRVYTTALDGFVDEKGGRMAVVPMDISWMAPGVAASKILYKRGFYDSIY